MEAPIHRRVAELPEDPLDLFADWYERAESEPGLDYPNAMCLSTVSPDGRPEGRFVIVHSFSADGFVFLTDDRSAKARSLAHTPFAALTVYWPKPLELQVRVDGSVERAPGAFSDEIFARRPRRSQITPWISRQSEVASLSTLQQRLNEVDEQWSHLEEIGRPPHWSGYCLLPRQMEFWIARPRRLHDRFRYRRSGDAWQRERLAP
jgi:pyridoxamine 5'-phosphate oxidase